MKNGKYIFNRNTPIAFLAGASVSSFNSDLGIVYSHGLIKNDIPIIIISSTWSGKVSDVTYPVPLPKPGELFRITLESEDFGLYPYLEVSLNSRNKVLPSNGQKNKEVIFKTPDNINAIDVHVKVHGSGETFLKHLTWEKVN